MTTFDKKDVEDIFSLTPLQESILYYYIQNPDSLVYLEQLCLEINGAIDLHLFRQAWDTLCRNNDMLRVVFRWEEVKQPIQIILKKHAVYPLFFDISDLDEKDRRQQLQDIKDQDGNTPFDLRHVPFRLILCKKTPVNYTLIISNHHIIYDGWSNGILLKEFFKTYDALCSGKTLQKSAPTKFKNHVKWLQVRNNADQEIFWNDYLGRREKGSDGKRVKLRRAEAGNKIRLIYSLEEKRAIDLFLKKNKLTSSMLIYCTWGLLLQQYLSCRDIVFDTTVSGRIGGLPGIEETVGLFINTLPLRFQASTEESLLELLLRMSQQLRRRESFEATSRMMVNEILESNGGNEILESLVVIENYPLDKAAMQEQGVLKVDSFSITGRSTYDVILMVMDFERLEIEIAYCETLFDDESIYRLAGQVDAVLKQIIRDPDQPVGQLPDMPEFEKARLLSRLRQANDESINPNQILPETTLQEKLAAVWADILRVDKRTISIDDNFFSFGGHSLKAGLLLARVFSEFKQKIPLARFFAAPTIHSLAEWIEGAVQESDTPLRATEEREYYPLSSTQLRLYMMQQVDPLSIAYNGPFFFNLQGELDIDHLENAFKQLIHSHESLRTAFSELKGQPVQIIKSSVSFSLQRIPADLSQIKQTFIKHFNLAQAPLLRVGLVETAPRHYLLMMDMHHIITDGVSTAVLIRQLAAGYRGHHISRPDVQYRDFSQWQHRQLMSGNLKKQESYWLNRFSDDLPRLQLYSDFQRPRYLESRGDGVRFSMNRNLYRQVKKQIQDDNVTLYIFLSALLNILLSRYTGQEDIIIGTPVAGRNRQELKDVVGLFTDGLVMRNNVRHNLPFKEFLQEIKNTCLEAFDNSDYPLGELLERLNLPRQTNRNPLFDVILNVQNQEFAPFELEGVTVTPAPMHLKIAKMDLTLEAVETTEGIDFYLEYRTELFKHATIERMARHLTVIAAEAAANPHISLAAIEMLTEEEKRQLTETFNSNPDAPASDSNDADTNSITLHELFQQQADRVPGNIAVETDTQRVSYEELEAASNRIADYLLRETGLQKGESVGLLLEPSVLLITALLGVLKAGGCYIPMDGALPEERIRQILNDAAAKVVISSHAHVNLLHKLQWQCPQFNTFLCLDCRDVYAVTGDEGNAWKHHEQVWDFIGETGTNEIESGGWLSSYTGAPLSSEEMGEYRENVLLKLTPYLHSDLKVLEIGCASGITMFAIAPKVGFYYGTDLSKVIIEKNKKRTANLSNIKLQALPAHEIGSLAEKDFDLVIINSVIQDFGNLIYLRNVIKAAVGTLSSNGLVFIGDVMDLEKKQDLLQELRNFKTATKDNNVKTKLDWDRELFVPRDYFRHLSNEFSEISRIEFSEKIHTIENELTKFRYDVLITIDKTGFKNKAERSAATPTILKRCHGADQLTGCSTARPAVDVYGEDVAYILFTSGSTGVPKGVVVEHRNVLGYIKAFNRQFALSEQDIVMQQASPGFDVMVEEIFPILSQGGTIAIPLAQSLADGGGIAGFIADHKVTLISVSPLMLRMVNELKDKTATASVHTFISGGDILTADCMDQLTQHAVVFNTYGPTESTVCATYYRCPAHPGAVIPIGTPITGYQCRVLSRYNQLQPVGVPGELTVGGVGVTRGYLNRPELTAEKFADNTYRTGDLVRRLETGDFEFLGRMDRQVKIRGYRIEVSEIEEKLRRHLEIKDAVIISEESAANEKSLHAYIVPHTENTLQILQLREYLGKLLPKYMIPERFTELHQIPLTPSGKTDRKALTEKGRRISTGTNYEAAGNETEKQLTAIYHQLLGLDKISITDDFFALGGHSLKAVALASQIYDHFKIRISLPGLFRASTIKKLAALITSTQADTTTATNSGDFDHHHITVAATQADYPASSQQRRLYAMETSAAMGTAYNITRLFRIEGPITGAALQAVFQTIVERHDSLRTSFHLKDGDIFQHIAGAIHFTIETHTDRVDSKSVPFTAPVPFDLSRAPLLRVRMKEESRTSKLLTVDIHHIISDGVSMEILAHECKALLSGATLEPLKLQYKDYSQWTHSDAYRQLLRKQEKYWTRQFKEEIPRLNLPLDYPRPATQRFAGKNIHHTTTVGTAAEIKEFARKQGMTEYMVFLALFNLLTAKLSNQADIVIGTPAAGRRNSALQGIIGMFINTLVLRNRADGDLSLQAYLKNIKENTLQAFENQDYPFENLINHIAATAKNTGPVFDVLFVLQDNLMAASTPSIESELRITPVQFVNETAKFDLTLEIIRLGDVWQVSLEYNTDLFLEQTVGTILTYYRYLLETLGTVDLNLPLRAVDILSAAEKSRLSLDFNRTRTPYPTDKTIDRLFYEQSLRSPDHIAVSADQQAVTYGELYKNTAQTARHLIAIGVKSGAVVALKTERSIAMVQTILAILKIGAAYLPIDPDYPSERIQYILKDSGATFIEAGFTAAPPDGPRNKTLNPPHSADTHQNPQTAVAYIIYTSGSTGRPKGVMVAHRSVVNLLYALQEAYPFGKNDTYLLKTNMTFDVSVSEIFGWFIGGGRLALAAPGEEKDPRRIIRTIGSRNVTHINFVPSMFQVFLEYIAADNYSTNPAHFKPLKYIFLAGEALLPQLVSQYRRLKIAAQLENIYGPTEAAVYACRYSLQDWEPPSAVPIGKPLPNVRLYIVDEKNTPQPPLIPGELVISGAGVAEGYVNSPGPTAAAFLGEGPNKRYKTGDFARLRPDGNILYLGRIDQQVKIRGFRIEPGEIQNHLLEHPAVHEAVVIAQTSGTEKYLCAYVVTAISSEEVKKYLEQRLPYYMVPGYIHVLEHLPLTPGGKINRQALPGPAEPTERPVVAPRTPNEKKLAQLWAQLLPGTNPKTSIGIHGNFFHLGGHSLSATRLILKIHRQFDIKLTPKQIFQNPTIAQMAPLIDVLHKQHHTPITIREEKEYYPLSHAQLRLWILSKLDQGSQTYNMPGSRLIDGELDLPALNKAFETLIKRHPMLRTTFCTVNGQPVQRTAAASPFTPIIPLSGEDNPRQTIETYSDQEAHTPFDLSRGPLMRVKCLTLSDRQHLLLFTIHHIVSDGLSFDILAREMNFFYDAFKNGSNIENEKDHAPLKVQYRDYVYWEQELLQGDKLQKLEEFWHHHLDGHITPLNLPVSQDTPAASTTFNGAHFSIALSPDQIRGSRRLIKENNITAYVFFLAVFNIFLSKLCNQQEITVVSGSSGRNHSDLEPLVGLFVRTFVIKNHPDPDAGLEQFLADVLGRHLQVLQQDSYPFEKIIAKYATQRQAANVHFIMSDRPGQNRLNLAKALLTLTVHDVDDAIEIDWEYNSDQFSRLKIKLLAAWFNTLLTQIIRNPDQTIAHYVLSTGSEKELCRYLHQQEEKIQAVYPMTPTQRDLYLNCKINPQGNVQRLTYYVSLNRQVDERQWREKLMQLHHDYPILNARAIDKERDYWLVIDKPPTIDFQVIRLDHENLNADAVEERIRELTAVSHNIEENWIKHYLFQLSPHHFISAVSVHHIIFDGISAALFFKALFANETERPLFQQSHQQYIHFHNRQNQCFDTPRIKAYWQEKFSDIEKLRGANGPSGRINQQAVVANEQLATIRTYCKTKGISVPLFFRALYGLLIRLYCSTRGNIMLREIIDTRTETNQAMLGCYYSALPLVFNHHIFVATPEQFFQYARSQRKELGRSKNISIFLQNQLSGEEEISFYYNFQTFFQLDPQNTASPGWLKDIMNYSPKEIHLLGAETDAGFRLKLTYDSARFDGPLFLERLLHVAAQVVQGVPRLADLHWMMPAEEAAVLRPLPENFTHTPDNACIHLLFQKQAAQTPDAAALVCGSLHISYRQLNRQANRVAGYLQQNRGIRPGDLVGIMAKRSELVVIAMLGILKAGAAYVPVDGDYPPDRIDFMLIDSAVETLMKEDVLKKIIFDEAISRQDPDCINSIHDPAYVIYTSGSTGKPKGVVVTHRNLAALFQNSARLFDFAAREVWTMFHSPCFDFSVWEMYGALLLGGKLIIIPVAVARDTGAYLNLVKQQGVTVLNQTPAAFYNFMETALQEPMPDTALNSIKYVIFGGDSLNPRKLAPWLKHFPRPRLINMFGITETTVHVTYKEISRRDIALTTSNIGTPLPQMNTVIVDNELRPLPPGIAGEICVGGAGVAEGYLNRPELSQQKFIRLPLLPNQKFYRSGDRVRVLPCGQMEYLGRLDHQVQLRGFRVEPGEIENCLLRHRDVTEAVVLVKETITQDKRLYAYASVSSLLTASDLKGFLRETLPDYMVPDHILILDRFPLTANGKIDRKQLPDAELSNGAQRAGLIEGSHEWRLAGIWADLLEIKKEHIGLDSDFFQIGGHSLNAVKLTLAVHKELAVKIPLLEVFSRPSLSAMARYIREAEQGRTLGPVAVETREYYPLSPAQERLFIAHKMSPESTGYNLPAAFRLEGTLDIQKLEEIFKHLINRHASLRTCFPELDGVPVQRVRTEVDFAIINATDLSGFVTPFDLTRAPLLRVGLFEENPEHHVLTIDIHHIIADGSSLEILVREFSALYRGESLAPLTISYIDYTLWLPETKSDPWLKMFEIEPEPLDLPFDFSRPIAPRYDGAGFTFTFAAASALKTVAREKEVTIYMLLLALFNVLLAKLSGTEDIVVGTPTANRGHADLQGVVGMFVNTLSMRNFPEGEKTFNEFLKELKLNTITAFQNQEYPFDELVNQVYKRRDTARHPLFDVMLELSNQPPSNLNVPNLTLTQIPLGDNTSKFDMSWGVTETAENTLDIKVTYASSLFKEETIRRFAAYFQELAGNLTADLNSLKLKDMEIIPNSEKQKILVDFNNTAADYPREKTLPELFAQQATLTPDCIAVTEPAASVSYAELNQRVRQSAHRLTARGIQTGDIVAIKMERSIALIETLLAVLTSGAAYLPISPDSPPDRINYLLQDSNAKILLTENSLTQTQDITPNTPIPSIIPITPNTPAYIIYTSGTSGRPKGVIIRHRSAVNVVTWFARSYHITSGTNVAQMSDVTFDPSVNQIFGTLLHGGTLHIINKDLLTNLQDLYQFIEKNNIHILNFVPQLLGELLLDRKKPPCIRYVLSGAEKLEEQVKNSLITMGYQLYNQYGPTETTIDALVGKCSEAKVTLGKPIANTKVYILDKYQKPVPLGVPGELYIAGDGLACGYLNQPALTAERFILPSAATKLSAMYRTGDLARLLPQGEIEFLGRLDHQVKISGFRIEPDEIQHRLLHYRGIKKALVTLHTDETGKKSLCAYLIPVETTIESLDQAPIKEFLAQSLPHYMIPAHVITIKEFPITSNGKIDIKSLPFPTRKNNPDHSPPQSPTEKTLARLWASVLNTTPSLDDNFFDLGHSLNATILISKIQKELQVNIPLIELFKTPTIRGLATYIQNAEPFRFSTIPAKEEKEYYPLLPTQKRLFVLQQSNPFSTAYNLPFFFKYQGPIDLLQFQTALNTIIHRHSALRTTFHTITNEPVQKIAPKVCLQIQQDCRTNTFIRPFDLTQPPLLRVQIQADIIAFDMHHIISDGTSIGILVRELMHFYQNDPAGSPAPLQYIDYAVWYRAQEDIENQRRQFWLRQFAGDLPKLELPLDFPRPPIQDYDGDTLSFTIDAHQTEQLNQLRRRQDTTLYITLSAIFTLYLSKLTSAEDIIIGTPTAGRRHPQLQDVVGMFVNTLAIRHYPTETKTFINYLLETKQVTLQAFENQEYPFDCLVARVITQRDISRNPLFDVMFELQNTEIHLLELPGLKLTPFHYPQVSSKFDMTWSAVESTDTLTFTIIYRTKLFKETTIQRFISYFKQLVTHLTAAPNLPLSQYVILPETEKHQLLASFNAVNTSAIPPIHQLFTEQAARTPDRIAAVHRASLSYSQLNSRARQLANALTQKGVRPDTIVALMTEPSLEMIIGILGILKAGGAFLPISPQTPPGRVTYMLEDSQALKLLTQSDILTLSAGADPVTPRQEVEPGNLVYVIYTSGTSGRPKGVMVEHRHLINYVSWFMKEPYFTSGDRAVLSSSFAFDLGYTAIIPPILSGGQVHFIAPELYQSPEEFLQYIQSRHITYLKMTPSLFSTFIRAATISSSLLKSIRFIVLGGEAIKMEDLEIFSHFSDAVIIDEYGPTEATIGTIARIITRIDPVPSIGTPITNTQVLILDKHMKLQPIGIPGELYIAGSSVARGYMNAPSLTQKSFVPHRPDDSASGSLTGVFYKTGDLARRLPDGNIQFIRRIDNQVKIRGYRVELNEIESQLKRLEKIKEAVVTFNRQNLCAYFVSESERPIQEIEYRLTHHLPNYMLPTHFIQLEKIPLTPNGKIDYNALPQPIDDNRTTYLAPQDVLQEKLVQIWRTVLAAPQVGISDNFFHLGGDSIKAIRIASMLRQEGYTFDIKDLFQDPSIQALAPQVKQITHSIPQEPVTGQVPLTPIQHWFFRQFADPLGRNKQNEKNTHYSHFNQSVMLFRSQGFNRNHLETAFRQILRHHDALRIIFPDPIERDQTHAVRQINPVRQINRDTTDPLYHLETRSFDTGNRPAVPTDAFRIEAQQLQQGINLQTGPLVRLGLFQTNHGDYLLIVVHHLVMDGVSWRILLADLDTAYRQLEQSAPIQFPPKTDSFAYYARTLQDYAHRLVTVDSPQNIEQRNYWQQVRQTPVQPLPVDSPIRQSMKRQANLRRVTFQLDIPQTRALLTDVHQAYNTRINDILLAALSLALNQWAGLKTIRLSLEGHGRDFTAHNLDISRTIGWFTTRFPLLLNTESCTAPGDTIKTVKEALRRVPDNGIGYGLMTYLLADEILPDLFRKQPPVESEISFNYLGQVENDAGEPLFTLSGHQMGDLISPQLATPFTLDLNSIVTEKHFSLAVTYNHLEYHQTSIEKFSDLYKQLLIQLIDHCIGRQESEATPSDLGAAELSIHQLDDIKNMLEL